MQSLKMIISEFVMKHRSFNAWRFITKVFVIINMWAYWGLMMWVPNSLTHIVSRSHDAGEIPTIVLGFGIVILLIDLMLSDHQVNGRRHWFGEKLVPAAYMVAGGGYLVFCLMCSLVPGGWVLMFNAFIQAIMCGWVAYLHKSKGTTICKECTRVGPSSR